MDEVSISNGAIICPFVTLTSNITIGKNFHANIYSYIAHDCIVGDNVTFAPSVKCNGNVIIKDNVYIGTGAIIKQGKENNPIILGANSVISAGSFDKMCKHQQLSMVILQKYYQNLLLNNFI